MNKQKCNLYFFLLLLLSIATVEAGQAQSRTINCKVKFVNGTDGDLLRPFGLTEYPIVNEDEITLHSTFPSKIPKNGEITIDYTVDLDKTADFRLLEHGHLPKIFMSYHNNDGLTKDIKLSAYRMTNGSERCFIVDDIKVPNWNDACSGLGADGNWYCYDSPLTVAVDLFGVTHYDEKLGKASESDNSEPVSTVHQIQILSRDDPNQLIATNPKTGSNEVFMADVDQTSDDGSLLTNWYYETKNHQIQVGTEGNYCLGASANYPYKWLTKDKCSDLPARHWKFNDQGRLEDIKVLGLCIARGNNGRLKIDACKNIGTSPNWIINRTDVKYQSFHSAKDPSKCIDVRAQSVKAGSNVSLYDCMGSALQGWIYEGRMLKFARNTDQCLEIQGSNPYNGANVEVWTCNVGTDAQKWIYDGVNNQIRSVKNYNKCLDLAGRKTDNKTNLQIWDCKSIETQQWYLDDPLSVLAKDREQTIHSGKEVNKCIHTKDDWMGKGAWLELWDCKGSTAQQWVMDGLQIKAVNNSNRCVTIENASEENGSQILLWDCHNDAHQQWIYDGVKRLIRSKKNLNKCLALSTNSAGNGTTIQLKNCSTNETQQWYLDYAATSPTDDPVQTIRPAYASEKCFHTQQGSTANGANVELWDCLGTEAQQWYFNGSSIKSNVNKNKCLDLLNHSTANGSNIAMWECNEGTNQQWIYDGLTKSIRSGQDPSKCIHIKAGSSDNGANVELWDCLGTVGQQFEIK